jgi:hypothetical protein
VVNFAGVGDEALRHAARQTFQTLYIVSCISLETHKSPPLMYLLVDVFSED